MFLAGALMVITVLDIAEIAKGEGISESGLVADE